MFEADFHKREDGFQSPQWGSNSKGKTVNASIVFTSFRPQNGAIVGKYI